MRTRDLVWDPSPLGWIQFNVAGVVRNVLVVCGGVLWDDKRVALPLFLVDV